MEEFGHFFEFFAALNSAYIVSNEFFVDLDKISLVSQKINDDLISLDKLHGHASEIYKIGRKRLMDEVDMFVKSNTKVIELKSVLPALDTQSIQIEEKLKEITVRLNFCKRISIYKNFNLSCLYGSLYCILMLLLNGFKFDYDSNINREALFIFNAISIISMGIFFANNEYNFFDLSPSYMNILLFFFVSIGLSFFCTYLIYKEVIPICHYNYYLFNDFLSITVPSGHFIYYFFKSTFSNEKKIEVSFLKKEMSKILNTCKKYSNNIDSELNSIKDAPIIEGLDS